MELVINNLLTKEDLPDFFISVAILVNSSGNPVHSGLLLKFDENCYLCHYPNRNEYPILERYDNDKYFFNIIDCFNIKESDEVAHIYEWLKIVVKNSKISYGYLFSSSKYNTTGDFEDGLNLGEVGTCVSFCLYILNNLFIDNDNVYLNIDDWDDSKVNDQEDEIFRNMLKMMNSNFNEEAYLENRKRIMPLELFVGSFQEENPITKDFVDKNIETVSEKIIEIITN